jgi:hypothetical protein
VRLLIARDGEFLQASVIASTAPPRLIAAAEHLIRVRRSFKPLPDEHSADHLAVEIPIGYVLR